MINQNSSTIHIPSEKMLMELASMPKSIQFAALSYESAREAVQNVMDTLQEGAEAQETEECGRTGL